MINKSEFHKLESHWDKPTLIVKELIRQLKRCKSRKSVYIMDKMMNFHWKIDCLLENKELVCIKIQPFAVSDAERKLMNVPRKEFHHGDSVLGYEQVAIDAIKEHDKKR